MILAVGGARMVWASKYGEGLGGICSLVVVLGNRTRSGNGTFFIRWTIRTLL